MAKPRALPDRYCDKAGGVRWDWTVKQCVVRRPHPKLNCGGGARWSTEWQACIRSLSLAASARCDWDSHTCKGQHAFLVDASEGMVSSPLAPPPHRADNLRDFQRGVPSYGRCAYSVRREAINRAVNRGRLPELRVRYAMERYHQVVHTGVPALWYASWDFLRPGNPLESKRAIL